MNAELFEAMEAHLKGQLTRDELEQKAEAAGVSDLDTELEWLRRAQLAIEADGLRKQLQQSLQASAPPSARIRRLRRVRPWGVAAAITLALAVAAWWWLGRSEVPDLYAQYEFVDPGLPVLMSDTQNYELQNALSFYSEARYAEAITRLEGFRSVHPRNDTASYYLGASYLYTGQPEKAEPLLVSVADDPASSFHQRAQWLRVLQALRTDDRASAREQATLIADQEDHLFSERARQLLQDLSSDD